MCQEYVFLGVAFLFALGLAASTVKIAEEYRRRVVLPDPIELMRLLLAAPVPVKVVASGNRATNGYDASQGAAPVAR
jgi:hypothetical protein